MSRNETILRESDHGLTKREFLVSGAALGAVTMLPFRVNAAAHSPHVFKTGDSDVTVRPVSHASFVLETGSAPHGLVSG